MMNLEEFSRQLESMHARFLRLTPVNGNRELNDYRLMWEETSEALGVTMEEMRVAEEELRQQTDELQVSRQAVEAERQRYRDLFDFAPDGYLVTDLLGVIKEANRAAGELIGVMPRYLAGKPLANFIAMDDRPTFRLGMHHLQQVGRREGWAMRMQPRRGAEYEATVTAAVVRDWNGSPTGLRWLIREGTDQPAKAAGGRRSRSSGRVTIGLPPSQPRPADLEERWTRAQHENEALRGLLYGLDLIVWEADAETGRYWFISPRAEELLGYPAESWIERPEFWAEIIHADDRPVAEAQRARCLREGQGGEIEYRIIASDGRAVWFRESLTLADEGEGPPRVLRGCLWDISRRKKVERQLYTDRRKLAEHLSDVWHLYLLGGQLQATLELAPVLEEILSAITSLQGAEMGALRLLHADRDELEMVVSLGLPPEYLEKFGRLAVGEQACGLAVRRAGPVIIEDVEAEGEAEVIEGLAEAARLGGYRACFSVPLVNRRGDLLGTIATFFREPHRPSERQFHMVEQYILQAADALDNARRHQAARDSDRRKEEFLATLAHELRNPLSAIQTCAHLIGEETLEGVSHAEVRDVIVRQAGYMTRLIEDLLDASRVSRGALELRKKPVDLADVVTRAVERVRQQVTEREHELVVSLPEEPLRLVADPTRLEQVLANLLTNACKYTDEGGRIGLVAAREGEEVIVRVRDTGIGLAPEALSGLFDLFTQVQASDERSGGGLGIGLALVKSLIELHGGSISARSDGPGHGSEFVVKLPMTPGTE